MPSRHIDSRNQFIPAMQQQRRDTDGLQRQLTTIICDPTQLTGDPDNNYATCVIGDLQGTCGIAAYGVAVWDGAPSTGQWVQLGTAVVPNLHRHGRPYIVPGPLAAGSPGSFPLDVPAGQLVQFEGVTCYTQASTTCTIAVRKNGTAISGFSAISVTSTSSGLLVPTGGSFAVADQDQFDVTISSPSGTGGLTVNFVTTIIS